MDILFLVVLFTIAWLITKFLLFILFIKFKLNISFKFNRNHLKNVSISKFSQQSVDKTGYELKIGKIWLSSCYVNRNVSERLLICSSNISLKLHNSIKNNSPRKFKIPRLVSIYLNFFGSLNLENISICIINQYFDIKQLKLERKSNRCFHMILHDLELKVNQSELSGNKFVLASSSDFKSIEFEGDKISLNFNLIKYMSDIKFRSSNSNSKWLKSIKSIRINKLNFNNRHVFNNLEVYSNNLEYLKINLNCLNDLMLNKNTRLVDNLLIEIFNSDSAHDLVFKCDQSNIFFYQDEIEQILRKFHSVLQNEKPRKISKIFRLEFKLNNFYISLIDRIQNDIYVLGSLFIDLSTNLKNLFKYECENFVLFKSSQKPKDKYSNNLFCQSNDLIKLFQWINYKKFKYPGAKRQYEHVWGNKINCNFFKFRLKLTDSKRKIVNILADQLYMEHSSELFDQLMSFVTNLRLTNESKRKTIFNFRLNQANLIYLFEKKYFLHFSIEDLGLKKHRQVDAFAKSFTCFQNRLTKLAQNESQYSMNQNTINHLKESEKTDLIFLLKSINLNSLNKNYSVSFGDVLITWSLKSHFILTEILLKPIQKYSSMLKNFSKESRSDFSLKILVETNVLLNFLFDYSQDSSKKIHSKENENYRYFNSNIKLIDTLSICLTNFYYFYSRKKFNLNINEMGAYVNTYDNMILYPDLSQENNSRKFLQVHKISIYTDDQSDYLLNERKSVKTQILKNKILFSKFELIHLIFLFQYDFAKMIDHILNLRKVLYKIHQVSPKKISLKPEGPLSVDFVLSVKQLKLVIEDDPFEVRLSYNYSLIVDEYMESLKRRQSLDQRRSIRENNLESQALEILLQRESKIYIQRSKMVYSSLPRKELFCICIENLELKALSDLGWHGRQKCYDILRKIDQVSPPPPTGQLDQENYHNLNPALNYLILWCRHIDLSINDLKFLFRDYTQPFLKINSTHFFGKFLGSEYQVPFRSRRQVRICVSSELNDLDYCNFEIERYMSPFKFYHDLSSKMAVLQYAYGPCWEGCMAQLNLSLEKIIHPARDPSKPLPWWDKSRLYLHGRLSACIQQCHVIYHVSMDPYNRTEEMKLVWSPLYLDWKNMELSFDGGLDVYLNTESKYDDCLLLHLPNLKAKIKIEWLCKTQLFNKTNEIKSNNNGHNMVILHAPDKLPQIVNSFEHDSYSQFRSEGLNLFFSFQCKLDNNDVPTCKFYASTSRFLQKINNLLSAVTRPTKRGNLFQNIRPRKTILSRHFKRVSFKFDLPKINVIYWSSASEQYGIQLDSEDFLMNSSLELDLVPFMDKLKRRPRPNWSIELMKFSVKQTNINLMSPGSSNREKPNNHSETDPFMLEMNERSIKFLDSKPAVRNFFMKIDSIAYEREKSCNYNFYLRLGNDSVNDTLTNMSMSSLVPIQVTNSPKHNLSIRNLKAKWNTVNRDVVYILLEIYNKSNRLRQNLSSHILKQYDLFTDQLLQNHILSQYKNQQKMSRKSNEFGNGNGQSSDKNQLGKSSENQFEELLKKLDNEKNLNSNVFCGDMPLNQSNWHFNNLIYGFHSVNRMDDIVSENLSIQLINSQIKLSLEDSWESDDSFLSFIPKPKRLPGSDKQQEYLIISAARANVVQHLHKPVWKSQRYLEKNSWSGHLENMQYFATLNNQDTNLEYWLNEELIDPHKDLPQNYLIENGCKTKESRLQLIVPKCHCEFYLIGFYDQIPDDNLCVQNTASTFNLSSLLSPHSEPKNSECHQYLLDLNPSFNEPIDCFTLIHHDVSLACNSSQYKLFMDIVNNLVLYFRPRRKQIIERQKAIKFNLELSMGNLDSLKNYIQLKQIETKNLLCNLRSLEKQIFYLKENIENEVNEYNSKFGHLQTPQGQFYVIQELKLENKNLEKQYKECKKFLNELSDELNILISCYKEMMVEKRAYNLAQTPMFVQYVMENEKQSNNPWLLLPSSNKFSDLIDFDQLAQKSILNSEIPKRFEIWFKNTKWKLNDDHSQNGLAKFLMKNFLYTKVMNQQELDCVEHNLEIESCKLQDLDPCIGKNKVGKIYEDVLSSLFDYSQTDGACSFSDQTLNNSTSTSGSASVSESASSSVSSLSFNENNLNSMHNSTMVRIYCKERPPVGIPVIEHLELNVSPLKINLTNRFFKTMIKYFFENQLNSLSNTNKSTEETELPQSAINSQNINNLRANGNQPGENSMQSKVHSPAGLKNILSHHKRPSESSLKGNNIIKSTPNVLISNTNNSINKNQDNNSNIHLHDDDIEIMKQRSANNNTFLCIKIPEIQLLVTYKGSMIDKKNIKDLNNVCLLFPLFEVHDKTWTWLDLINALKSHVKKALLSQALKHKLIKIPIQPVNKLINRNKRSNSQQQLTNSQIEENEKMTFLKLFGTKFIEKKSLPSTPSNINKKNSETDNKEDTDLSSPLSIKNKSMVSKSKSSIGFGFKKHFSKINKEKVEPNANSSDITILSLSDNILNNDISESDY